MVQPPSPSLRVRCPRCGEAGQLSQACGCGEIWPQDEGVFSSRPDFQPSGFGADRAEHLAGLSETHFWFPPRRRLLLSLLDRLRAKADSALVELGCGTGTFLGDFASRLPTVVAVEGHLDACKVAATRDPRVKVLHDDVTETCLEAAQFDVVGARDVLEHVDPIAFLSEARRLVRPGGSLLLTVPASMQLWSALDDAAGHRVRYDLDMLREELHTCGWHLEGHTHYQALLFPLVWWTRRGLANTRSPLERRPPWWVQRVLGAVNELEVTLWKERSLPFGSSLVAWARPQ